MPTIYLTLWTVFCAFSVILANLPFRKFIYKHSFKGPHLVQTDGSIPFWEYGGDAIASEDSIRITPSLRSKKGFVWSKEPFTGDHWEVEVAFRVSGRGRVGADGLAVWFTSQKGTPGPVFGSNDQWTGLAVIMDSFDNDAQHNNPYVMAVVNDGTKTFDHARDGVNMALAGCMRDFRNRPFPVRIKVEYYNKGLSIHINNGLTSKKDEFDLCMRAEAVDLPKVGFFGVTAATGGLADDHDVMSFITHELFPPSDPQLSQSKFTEEEKIKYDKEFEEYYEKLQKAKTDYRKDHQKPGQIPVLDDDIEEDDKWYETQDRRELKQIFEGQAAIDTTLRLFGTKIDDILERQQRILQQMTPQGQGQIQPPQGQGGVPGDAIRRDEVNQLINANHEMTRQLRDVKTMVGELTARKNDLNENPDVGPSLRRIEERLGHVAAAKGATSCPPSNCITTAYFFIFATMHVAALIGYFVYRSHKEAQAKKFY